MLQQRPGIESGSLPRELSFIKEKLPENERSTHWLKAHGKRALKVIAILNAFGLAGGIAAYETDVSHVREELRSAHAYIMEHSPVPTPKVFAPPLSPNALEHLSSAEQDRISELYGPDKLATVITTGFGRVETPYPDKPLAQFAKIGALWEPHYNNGRLDVGQIADELIAKAHAEGVTQIGLYGDSMGGLVSLELATEILSRAPDISIPFLIFDSTPMDETALSSKSRADGYEMLKFLGMIPEAQYSHYVRIVGEMSLRWDRVIDEDSGMVDPDKFKSVFDEVWNEVWNNHDLAANSLLADQFRLILNAHTEDRLNMLGHLPEERRPVIAYMGAKYAKDDDVVNVPLSSKMLERWGMKFGLTILPKYSISDFHHGDQWRSYKEYNQVLGEDVIPGIASALEEMPGKGQAYGFVRAEGAS